MGPLVGNDSPSGVGLGPVGIALNVGRFSICSSRRGNPSPALAQLTLDSNFLSSSENKIKFNLNATYPTACCISYGPRISIFEFTTSRTYLLQVRRDSQVQIYNLDMLDMYNQQEQFLPEDFWRTDQGIPSEIHLKRNIR